MKALIVDDEQYGRLMVAMLLTKSQPDAAFSLASGVQEARLMLARQSFDVLFIDIDMPEQNGLDFVESIRKDNILTPVIIVTAYSKFEYTRKAIHLGVVDYILKPVIQEDFDLALKRLADYKPPIASESRQKKSELILADRITLKVLNGLLALHPAEIVYCEADAAYAIMYLKNGEIVRVFESLGDIEERLSKGHFCRCGRKFIINLTMLRRLNVRKHSCILSYDKGEYEIELSDPGFQLLRNYLSGSAAEE